MALPADVGVTTEVLRRGASPVAAVMLAFFGFTFYWCLLLTAAWLEAMSPRARASAAWSCRGQA